MPQAATKKVKKPDGMLTLKNHKSSAVSLTIPNAGMVEIKNADTSVNLVQLWDEKNAARPALALYFDPGATVTLTVDPGSKDTMCYYNVIDPNAPPKSVSGGGNKIIIGSGGGNEGGGR